MCLRDLSYYISPSPIRCRTLFGRHVQPVQLALQELHDALKLIDEVSELLNLVLFYYSPVDEFVSRRFQVAECCGHVRQSTNRLSRKQSSFTG